MVQRRPEQAANALESEVQYSLPKILWIWAAAALPMAILGWIIYPLVAPDHEVDPLGASVTRVLLIVLGLMWQFVLSLIIVRQEQGDLSWRTIKHRLRLNPPRDPKTGTPRRALWLWLLPAILGIAATDLFAAPSVNRLWVTLFPFLAEPPGFNFSAVLEDPAIQASLKGAWWFLGLFIVFSVFNTFLGEEFLFRGILLPRMEGVFGRWSWLANGLLFGLYHLHQPWGILTAVLGGVFFESLPAWRYRSTWLAIIVHSAQSVFFAFLILGIVTGLA